MPVWRVTVVVEETPVVTFKVPAVPEKKVLLMWVAPEPVAPHVPKDLVTPLSDRVAVVWFKARARTEPLATDILLKVVPDDPAMF